MSLDGFDLSLRVEIRDAVADDVRLPARGFFLYRNDWWDSQFAQAVNGEIRLLCATVGDAVVGRIGIDLKRTPDVAHIGALDVFPGLRSMGLGGRLIAAAERVARDAGVRTAEIYSYKDNPRATELYERLGYEREGEVLDEWIEMSPDDTIIAHADPCWVMRKPL